MQNREELLERLGGNYKKEGPGILRKIPEETLGELKKIFEVTGGIDRYEKIEAFSKKKAEEMDMTLDDSMDNEYFRYIYKNNSDTHLRISGLLKDSTPA